MRHSNGHNYRNSSFIVDVAMGQIPCSTERISSYRCFVRRNLFYGIIFKLFNDYINNSYESVTVKTISQLRVVEPPGFVHSMSDEWRDGYIELTPGGAVTLSCRAVGRPKPEVRWYKDDRRLPAHDDGWIIVLDDVRRQHGGRYTCHVTNRLGSISRTYIVHVAGMHFAIYLIARFPA